MDGCRLGWRRDDVQFALQPACGVIIGSSLKREGVWWNEVETDRVAAFMNTVRTFRNNLK